MVKGSKKHTHLPFCLANVQLEFWMSKNSKIYILDKDMIFQILSEVLVLNHAVNCYVSHFNCDAHSYTAKICIMSQIIQI